MANIGHMILVNYDELIDRAQIHVERKFSRSILWEEIRCRRPSGILFLVDHYKAFEVILYL